MSDTPQHDPDAALESLLPAPPPELPRRRLPLPLIAALGVILAALFLWPWAGGYGAGNDTPLPHDQLTATLARVRLAVNLYALQHEGQRPGADFVAALTGSSPDPSSGSSEQGGTLAPPFPANPLSGNASVRIVPTLPDGPTGPEGWIYALDTGELRANVPGHRPALDGNGRRFFDF